MNTAKMILALTVSAAAFAGCVAGSALTTSSGPTSSSTATSSSAATPDFSGVYRREFRQSRAISGSSVDPLERPSGSPKLTPDYLEKWKVVRDSLAGGSYEYDYGAQCFPPGMPAMMGMDYGMEVMQTKDKITFFSELNDALRRVYLDGRKPTASDLEDLTYAGFSTGHWEGDTLIVDTVAVRGDNKFLDMTYSPQSDKMTVRERIRFIEPGLLEDRITVTDPEALTEPWEIVHNYRKQARGGSDQLREFACSESIPYGLTREVNKPSK